MNIKRLVLGTAAGALAVTGAQAADLPVVVEPVEYVRICDAYGVGYYYIPGTETCLRVAGRLRADYQFFGDLDDLNIIGGRGYDRDAEQGYRFRARAYLYMDSRTSTEFGLLRTFVEAQFESNNGRNGNLSLDQGFIQFGGLTFGRARSFWDFADAFYGSQFFFEAPTSDQKLELVAYTAAFGNGFSASISIEDSVARQDGIASNIAVGNFAFGAYEKEAWVPDVVANVRVDQGWGSAQIMGFLGYREAGQLAAGGQQYADSEGELAWGVGGGVAVNVPFGNDTSVGIQAAYAHGAPGYVSQDGATGAVDGFYNAVTNAFTLTDSFSVAGGFATDFTPAIGYTLAGGYEYHDQANALNDVYAITVDSYLTYEIVSGFILGAGIQYKYVNNDGGEDGSALAGFLRAQRTF